MFLAADDESEEAGRQPEPGWDEAVCLTPDVVLDLPGRPAYAPAALSAFLRISAAIHGSGSLDELASEILRPVLEAIPADRAAILLFERWSPDPVSAHCRDRRLGICGEIEFATSPVARAFREGAAILGPETQASIIAVPLFGRNRTLGVLYLESCNPAMAFEQDHLQLATAIGVVAGAALENARKLEWLQVENQRADAEVELDPNMVGESPRLREVRQIIAKVAPADCTVLIRGESGTGKELVARAIHRQSPRADHPFTAINCAALTDTLLESELFGHERGAFTGAVAQKRGKLEVANGGTVLLDEVGELSPAIQAKLLRVLQEREFERIGGTRPIRVDIRIIAATNRDLRSTAAGSFRQDLLYRLDVVSISMPALRERREDIPLLAFHFAAKHAVRAKRKIAGISPEAYACLLGYDWPGNVRELENAIERAVVLGSTELVLPEDLPETVLESTSAASAVAGSYHQAVREAKKAQILSALEKARGSYTEAARTMGVHPNYLHRLIRNLQLKDAIKRLIPAQ